MGDIEEEIEREKGRGAEWRVIKKACKFHPRTKKKRQQHMRRADPRPVKEYGHVVVRGKGELRNAQRNVKPKLWRTQEHWKMHERERERAVEPCRPCGQTEELRWERCVCVLRGGGVVCC